ncbi:MAG: phosphoribosylaminoimidazolesuccinocarboxamide synthase [Bacillota bacterium]
MEKGNMIYEGKAKKLYETNSSKELICEFKDDATAFDGKKKGQIKDKGEMNTELTNIFFTMLEEKGIKTHLIDKISEKELLVKKVEIIPVEVVMRNKAAGSIAKRLGLKEGTDLSEAVLEFYYKSDELGDPMINQYHIFAQDMASEKELDEISELAFKINDYLKEFLASKNIDLIDFKLEFGKDSNGNILLADEITPDTCRLWDSETQKKLDKDRFRRDLGEVEGAYQEILKRLKG